MSNRRKSNILFRCMKEDCSKPAIAMRKYAFPLLGIPENTPIFACVDHIAELDADLARGIRLHQSETV